MGGAAKLKSVHALRAKIEEQSENQPSPPGEVTIGYPDRMHVAMTSPMGEMSVVFTPTTAFMAAQGQVRDIPASQKKESLEQIKRDLTYIAQHADDPKFTFTANGSEKIGDVETTIVDIDADGTPIRWYVDAKTGRILRERYSAIGRSGPFQGETDLSDWKTFDGLLLPAKHVNKQDGKESSTVTFTEIHLNPQVDPKIFEKPTASPAAAQ
jgi:outer membrane lipoprotein-sorting protein